MAVNHVQFNDHSGPFKVVVESSGKGVRVNFDGWGKGPLVASADKIRIIYWVAGRKEIDFEAEATLGGAVAVSDQRIGRYTQGKRIVIGLGRAPRRALRPYRSKEGGIEPGWPTGRSLQT